MDNEDHEIEKSKGPLGSLNPHLFTILAILSELGLVFTAFFLAWIWPKEEISPAEWNNRDALFAVVCTLPLVLVLVLITWTPLRNLKPLRKIRSLLRKYLIDAISGLQVWQILAISMSAGLGEEVLFRGALQPRLGILITSLLFGVVHWITPTYFIFATLIGAYLGWMYEYSNKNLLVPIIIHALYDTIGFFVVKWELSKKSKTKFD